MCNDLLGINTYNQFIADLSVN